MNCRRPDFTGSNTENSIETRTTERGGNRRSHEKSHEKAWKAGRLLKYKKRGKIKSQ